MNDFHGCSGTSFCFLGWQTFVAAGSLYSGEPPSEWTACHHRKRRMFLILRVCMFQINIAASGPKQLVALLPISPSFALLRASTFR